MQHISICLNADNSVTVIVFDHPGASKGRRVYASQAVIDKLETIKGIRDGGVFDTEDGWLDWWQH